MARRKAASAAPEEDAEDTGHPTNKRTRSPALDVASFFNDTLDVIARRQGFESSTVDVVPPMSSGLLALDLVLGGGIRPCMLTGAGDEQCAKTTVALHVMGAAIKANIPLIAFVDYEGCVTRDTQIGYGKGKSARLDELFDLSGYENWKPKTWVGQVRRDIDTVEPGHTYGGTGVRTGELYYRGVKPTTEVTFNTGHRLTGYRHPMFVLRNGFVVVVRIENLQIGDQVLVTRSSEVDEEWRPVKGFGREVSRRYEVSNLGNVRSLDVEVTDNVVSPLGKSFVRSRVLKGRVLRPQSVQDGHLWVALCDGVTQNKQLVHRIVARTFLGKAPKNKPLVLHWNDNPKDNRLSNLHYGDDFDNSQERHTRGRACKGEQAWTAALSEKDVGTIKDLRNQGWGLQEIADRFGVANATVYNICAGLAWKHLEEERISFTVTEEILLDYELAAVTSVGLTGQEEPVFDVSLRGTKGDVLPHSIITNGVVTHNSTKNSKPYVHSILKGQGIKMSMDQVFGKPARTGKGWEIPPRVRYRSEVILENFYKWMSEVLRELPDKRYVEGKWWLVFDDKNKNHKAKVGDFVDTTMTRKYGNGLWVPAADDKIQGIVFVDSYTAMNPESKDEEDISNQLSVKASAFSKQLERIKGRMAQKMVTVYGLNHLRANPMVMYGPKETEKGGKALQQFSDVRIRQTSRALSAAPFQPKAGKKTYDEQEPSVEFEGLDTYRYVNIKAIKNKLWTPQRDCFIRLWVEDGSGTARGIDPVFDTVYYLKATNQLSGKRAGFKLNLEGLGQGARAIPWQTLKKWILGDKETMTNISKAMGYKPMSIRAFCFKQIADGTGERLYVENRRAAAGTGDEDSDDSDE